MMMHVVFKLTPTMGVPPLKIKEYATGIFVVRFTNKV